MEYDIQADKVNYLLALQENERRQRCFGIVALVMLAIVVIGSLVVINANK